MLLSFSATAQSPCQDSLRLAMQYGRVLVRNISLRDSLLAIRLQTITALQAQILHYKVQNDSLLKSNLLLGKLSKTHKSQRNIFIALLAITLVLIL